MRRAFVSVVLLASSLSFAAPESAAFVPLSVESSPALQDPVDVLQKKFFAVAREKSGYTLALRPEVEAAMTKAKVTDVSSDSQLARVAVAASAKNAGAFSFRLTDRGELLLQGRVVSDDGKLLKSAMISVPRNNEAMPDALTRAAGKFFEVLNNVAKPEPVVASVTAVNSSKEPSAPPMVIRPVDPPNPGTPLRITGVVIGAAGIAATVTGVVLFATAGTVEKDIHGNVSINDVDKIPGIRSAQGAGLGALTAGVALTLTGVLMFALAPDAPVTAGVAPTSGGAMFAVGGSF